MLESTLTYVVTPILSAMIGGLAWLVKRYFNKKDEEQARIFEERDKDKNEMKENISNLQAEVTKTKEKVDDLLGIIVGCEHVDCPSRPLLKKYLLKEKEA